MDITGISAFITVYMKLFIQSNLVKKGSTLGYILIERTTIFIEMYTFFKNPMRLKDCYLQKCIG
jgi:hypothetical protein